MSRNQAESGAGCSTRPDNAELCVVTGALSYTGKYIAQRLLSLGKRVRTLTRHPNRLNPFAGQVEVKSFPFDEPIALAASLEGASTLYNTYWVRFRSGQTTFETAVANTQALIRAAEDAGVRRIVHLSVTNPSPDSHLPYFRGKAELERAIMASGLSYAIIRPSVVFGIGDILINNIAWFLRRFPVFAIPGAGDYRLQPVSVEDVAEIAVCAGQQDRNVILDAVGPETYTFEEFVRLIAGSLRSRAKIIHLDPGLASVLLRIVGLGMQDLVLTRDEISGLMQNLLISNDAPTGRARFRDWLGENVDRLGVEYASELARHYRPS